MLGRARARTSCWIDGDLRAPGCDILTLGIFFCTCKPTLKHRRWWSSSSRQIRSYRWRGRGLDFRSPRARWCAVPIMLTILPAGQTGFRRSDLRGPPFFPSQESRLLTRSCSNACTAASVCAPARSYDATKLERKQSRGHRLMRASPMGAGSHPGFAAKCIFFCLGCLACMKACPGRGG